MFVLHLYSLQCACFHYLTLKVKYKCYCGFALSASTGDVGARRCLFLGFYCNVMLPLVKFEKRFFTFSS